MNCINIDTSCLICPKVNLNFSKSNLVYGIVSMPSYRFRVKSAITILRTENCMLSMFLVNTAIVNIEEITITTAVLKNTYPISKCRR